MSKCKIPVNQISTDNLNRLRRDAQRSSVDTESQIRRAFRASQGTRRDPLGPISTINLEHRTKLVRRAQEKEKQGKV